jgi:hydroxymethylbilane synthase
MKTTWIVGTRGSKLALAQTRIVIDALKTAHPGYVFETKIIKTTGDTIWDKPLAVIGGKGVFVKEIEDEFARGSIDLAVHSTKDIPADLAPGLEIGAYLTREDPRDVFISTRRKDLGELVSGSRIGTGSLRRKAQILRWRPGITVVPIRGNVDTRIRKIDTENLDGIMLAAAGVRRLGLDASITQVIPADIMVPTAGQGAIGIEIRRNDAAASLVAPINDQNTWNEVSIERTIQTAVGGGCTIPLGINARIEGNHVTLNISLGDEEGAIIVHESLTAPLPDRETLISKAVEILLNH